MPKALLLSDIHGRVSVLRSIVRRAECDVAFVAGDLSNYSGGAYAEVLGVLSDSLPLTVVVPGNVDPPEVTGADLGNVMVIHERVVEAMGLNVAGVGGGIGFPFWGVPYLTDSHIAAFLLELEEDIRSSSRSPHVLVTHTPPYMTGLDRVYSGEFVGSKKIRDFVEAHGPMLHVCGHIHEGRGVARIGRTVVANPGPAMAGYYGVAIIGESGREVSVELAHV